MGKGSEVFFFVTKRGQREGRKERGGKEQEGKRAGEEWKAQRRVGWEEGKIIVQN